MILLFIILCKSTIPTVTQLYNNWWPGAIYVPSCVRWGDTRFSVACGDWIYTDWPNKQTGGKVKQNVTHEKKPPKMIFDRSWYRFDN